MASLLIIGIGNSFRSDDGAGLVVAQQLRAALPDAVICEAGGEGASLMELWQDADEVILIDAVSSGAAPGTIQRIDAGAGPLPASFRCASTHAFGVVEAIEMARVLGRLPAHLIIYGIEGRNFAIGEGLSPEVAQACAEVTAQVQEEARRVTR